MKMTAGGSGKGKGRNPHPIRVSGLSSTGSSAPATPAGQPDFSGADDLDELEELRSEAMTAAKERILEAYRKRRDELRGRREIVIDVGPDDGGRA